MKLNDDVDNSERMLYVWLVLQKNSETGFLVIWKTNKYSWVHGVLTKLMEDKDTNTIYSLQEFVLDWGGRGEVTQCKYSRTTISFKIATDDQHQEVKDNFSC